jgi:chromosome segregation ATPase
MMNVATNAQAALDLLMLLSNKDATAALLADIEKQAADVHAREQELVAVRTELDALKKHVTEETAALARSRSEFESSRKTIETTNAITARSLSEGRTAFEGEKAEAFNKITLATDRIIAREKAAKTREDALAKQDADVRARETAVTAKETAVEALRVEYQTAFDKMRALVAPK